MALKWVFSEQHEIKQDAQSPNINGYTIIGVADDFRSHIFLGATMCFSSSTTDWPGETKICNFIPNVVGVFVLVNLFQQNVLWLDISVNEIFLMNASEPFHNLNNHFDSLFKRKGFARKFGLISEEVSLLTVLHHDDDKIGGWIWNWVTSEFFFISYNVRVVEFFHDADFLVDVFFEEWFFLEVGFADNFDCVEFVLFWVNRDVLFLARTT